MSVVHTVHVGMECIITDGVYIRKFPLAGCMHMHICKIRLIKFQPRGEEFKVVGPGQMLAFVPPWSP